MQPRRGSYFPDAVDRRPPRRTACQKHATAPRLTALFESRRCPVRLRETLWTNPGLLRQGRRFTLRRYMHKPVKLSPHVQIKAGHSGHVECRLVDFNTIEIRIDRARTLAVPEAIRAGWFGSQSVPTSGRRIMSGNVP